MFLTLVSMSLAAGLGERIENAARDGRDEKAWELCNSEDAGEAIQAESTRNACASVHLNLIQAAAAPAPPSQKLLDGHWRRWPGSPAAVESKEAAGKMALVAAGTRQDAIAEVGRLYTNTAAGTEAVDRLWLAACSEATPEAMRGFYESWPKASQVDTARRKELELAWDQAALLDTPEAWRRMVAEYPLHPRRAEAIAREETQAFNRALAQNTPEGWRIMLAAYPTHPRRQEAEGGLRNASFSLASKQGSDALLTFALTWPEDPRSATILAQIAEQTQVIAWVGTSAVPLTVAGTTVGTSLGKLTLSTPLRLAGARVVDARGELVEGVVWQESDAVRVAILPGLTEGMQLSVVVGMDTWSLVYPLLVTDVGVPGVGVAEGGL